MQQHRQKVSAQAPSCSGERSSGSTATHDKQTLIDMQGANDRMEATKGRETTDAERSGRYCNAEGRRGFNVNKARTWDKKRQQRRWSVAKEQGEREADVCGDLWSRVLIVMHVCLE